MDELNDLMRALGAGDMDSHRPPKDVPHIKNMRKLMYVLGLGKALGGRLIVEDLNDILKTVTFDMQQIRGLGCPIKKKP